MLIDICVHREEHNKYTSKAFTKLCKQYKSNDKELLIIFDYFEEEKLFCPTIFKNKKNGNIVLVYEDEEDILYITISKAIITFKNSYRTLYSNKQRASILETLEEFLQ